MGLAVGDIENIQASALIDRYVMQVTEQFCQCKIVDPILLLPGITLPQGSCYSTSIDSPVHFKITGMTYFMAIEILPYICAFVFYAMSY